MFRFRLVVNLIGIVVVAGFFKDTVGDEILAGTVGVDDGLNQIFRHIPVVGQQLLRILWQAIAAIAEGRIVVMGSDSRIEADAVDDGAGVEILRFGIGIKLIEVGNAQGEIGVGKQLDGLGFRKTHEENRDVFLPCTLIEHIRKGFCCLFFFRVGKICSDDDAGRIQVVIERLRFTQKFRRKQNVIAMVLPAYAFGITDRDRALDDDPGKMRAVLICGKGQFNDFLDSACIKEVSRRIIVGRCSNDDIIRLLQILPGGVGGCLCLIVEHRFEIEFLSAFKVGGEVLFDPFILDR